MLRLLPFHVPSRSIAPRYNRRMLLARVRRTIAERRLLRRGDRVIVAVSGGPDSMAMLDVLGRLRKPLGISLVAVGVDHGLRAEASGELALAAAHAETIGVTFERVEIVVPPVGSLQARAREARYEALRAAASRHGAQRVAVGHTQDDQAETVLSRLLRGAGPRGVAGIAPRRADGVVRPLIDASRAQVRSWNEAHGLPVAWDPSNSDARFQRVRVRSELLPMLAREDRAVVAHLARLADDARALEALARREGRRLLARVQVSRTELAVSRLAAAPRASRRAALRSHVERLVGCPVGRAHLDALDGVLQGSGQVRLPGGWVIAREGDILRATLAKPLDRPMKKHERDDDGAPID